MLWIRLIGAVEMGSAPALSRAVDRVREVRPRRVLIDLAGVTFAGSVLVNFLVRVHTAGCRCRICLLRAGPMSRVAVTATGLADFVTFAGGGPGRTAGPW